MRVLITGITGFAGGHLAQALLQRGDSELFGFSRKKDWPQFLSHFASSITLQAVDYQNPDNLRNHLQQINPDRIYHLAGYASVGKSFHEPEQAWRGNLIATKNLYDAIVGWGGSPKILFVSSGLVYGEARLEGNLRNEESPFYPVDPYALSKATADLLSFQYSRFPGLTIFRARPLNHIGPGQSAQYSISNFARQIAAIEQRQLPPVLNTGPLSARRDFCDVRDIVQAYSLIMEKGRNGEAYNLASGNVFSIQEVLNRLLKWTDISIEVKSEENLRRPTEPNEVIVSTEKVHQEIGWNPSTLLDQTLLDLLNFWRTALKQAK